MQQIIQHTTLGFAKLTRLMHVSATSALKAFVSLFSPVLRAFGRPPLTLFTNGRKVSELGLSDDQLKALQIHQCDWVETAITRLTPTPVKSNAAVPEPSSAVIPASHDGLKVELADGNSIDIGMMYIRPPFVHSPLVSQLGLKLKEPFMTVETGMFNNAIGNPLVYAGGDLITPMAGVAIAISNGGIAGAGCNHDLSNEDWGVTLKEAGIEVKPAGHDLAKEAGKLIQQPAKKEEAVKAANGD